MSFLKLDCEILFWLISHTAHLTKGYGQIAFNDSIEFLSYSNILEKVNSCPDIFSHILISLQASW